MILLYLIYATIHFLKVNCSQRIERIMIFIQDHLPLLCLMQAGSQQTRWLPTPTNSVSFVDSMNLLLGRLHGKDVTKITIYNRTSTQIVLHVNGQVGILIMNIMALVFNFWLASHGCSVCWYVDKWIIWLKIHLLVLCHDFLSEHLINYAYNTCVSEEYVRPWLYIPYTMAANFISKQ